MLRSAKDLYGYVIRATDGEFGKAHDVYFDDQAWAVRYLVVETGDWLLGRKVLLTTDLIGSPAQEGRVLPVMLTMREVERSPGVNSDKPVSLQMRRDPYEYYIRKVHVDLPREAIKNSPGFDRQTHEVVRR